MNSPTGLSITNPLVLYRSLIATNRIRPDPAQLRLGMYMLDIGVILTAPGDHAIPSELTNL